MDAQRWLAIKKASTRLAEANAAVRVVQDSSDITHILQDCAWPDAVKQRATEVAKDVLIEYATREQAEAQKAWDDL